MTQKELADELHVTDKAVSKWERGVSYPDINTIPKLAGVLEISVDELLHLQKSDSGSARASTNIVQKINDVIDLVLKAVGIGMGVATLVLSVMDGIKSTSAITMLSIGLISIGIAGLRSSS